MRPATVSPGEHLIIPYAHASTPECDAALADLPLPHLEALLQRWQPAGQDHADEYTLSPPHDRALGQALGWTDPGDGRWPWAAWHAGLADQPCAWFTPCHWSVGMEQVTLLPPDDLDLRADESQALLDALAPWALEDGIALHLETPQRWRATGEALRDLPCASLDRVLGRRIDPWLLSASGQPAQRTLLRLMNEAQMLFYTHPVNDARGARGLPLANGLWISASGVWPGQDGDGDDAATVQVLEALRPAALAGDWTAWARAWASLDAGPLASALDNSPDLTLVLCGEQHAVQWAPAPPARGWRALWPGGRGRPPALTSVLEAL